VKWIVEGSTDGEKWYIFAMTKTATAARTKAASCIEKSRHTYVRIIQEESK